MDTFWLVTSTLGLVVIYFVYWLATIHSNYWKKRGIKSVDSLPLLGVMSDMFLKNKGVTEILNDVYKKLEGEKFGGYFQFITPTIMIRDPEIINQILIKDFTHFEDRGPSMVKGEDLFASSVGSLTGDEWRSARHKLTATFTSGKLKMMFSPIKECAERAVTYLNNNLGNEIEAKDITLKYMLNVVANVAFGLDLDTFDDKQSARNEFINVSNKFFKPSFSQLIKFALLLTTPKVLNLLRLKLTDNDVNDFFQKLTKDIVVYRESTGTRRNDFLQIMLDQREKEKLALSGNNEKNTDLYQEDMEDPDDKELLDQLKNTPAGKNKSFTFTDDFIAAQTFVFISGGSDSTSTGLGFALYELAANPHIQMRVQQEIDDALSNHEFSYQAVKKMTYMEQCIYESMRSHNSGALIRMCTKDYQIPGTKVLIEKGNVVSIPVGSLQKDSQYFPNPEKFDPDRFSNMDNIPKGVFFPFGGGPRMCIVTFTEDFIAAQTFLFISGGSETTSTVLGFILYELAANPEIQLQVQQEIDNVLSSNDFSFQAIKKMTYMEQCINETMRLHPILGVLTRVCTKDFEIPGTKVVIEKGNFVNIPVGNFHKDPQYFPNPEKFDPERFSNMDNIPKGVYFSFGGGPRICIAMRLAMLEMKILLAKIFLNFTVTVSKKTKEPLTLVKNSFIPVVEGGIWLQFEKRKLK